MIGAIIGDIVGSYWEFKHNKDFNKDFILTSEKNEITDDSVLSCATAYGLLNNDLDFFKHYFQFAIKNGHVMGGYGQMFVTWLHSKNKKPYNSFGNGSAMRVSPIGWAYDTEEEILKMASRSAQVTHNHPEGIKGAQVVCYSIFRLRHGATKEELKKEIEEKFHYNLDLDLYQLWKNYQFNPSCQGTVPQALSCFLNSSSYEDTIRNVLYIGGDTDTLGCIAGSIAEAYYEIPDHLVSYAFSKLKEKNEKLFYIVKEFDEKFCSDKSVKPCFDVVNKYIRTLSLGEIGTSSINRNDLFISFVEKKHYDTLKTYNHYGIFGKIEINPENYLLIHTALDDSHFPFWKRILGIKTEPSSFNNNALQIIEKISKNEYNNVYIQCKDGKSYSVAVAHFLKDFILKDYDLRTDFKEAYDQIIYDSLKETLNSSYPINKDRS